MKPWFEKEAKIIPFPKKPERQVIKMPSVSEYPDFITGVLDLQARRDKGQIGQDSYDRLYQDLIHRFMKKEDPETPWFIAEQIADKKQYADVVKQLASFGIQFNKQPLNVKPGRPMNMRATGSTKQELVDALKKIDGMFAFSFLDRKTKKIYLTKLPFFLYLVQFFFQELFCH